MATNEIAGTCSTVSHQRDSLGGCLHDHPCLRDHPPGASRQSSGGHPSGHYKRSKFPRDRNAAALPLEPAVEVAFAPKHHHSSACSANKSRAAVLRSAPCQQCNHLREAFCKANIFPNLSVDERLCIKESPQILNSRKFSHKVERLQTDMQLCASFEECMMTSDPIPAMGTVGKRYFGISQAGSASLDVRQALEVEGGAPAPAARVCTLRCSLPPRPYLPHTFQACPQHISEWPPVCIEHMPL